jgi:nucleotide-binding universal stress UspA family protein
MNHGAVHDIVIYRGQSMLKLIIPLSPEIDAERTLKTASLLSDQTHAEVELLHAAPDGSKTSIKAGEALLARARASLPTRTDSRIHLIRGEPASAIVQFANETRDAILVLTPRWSEENNGFAPDSVTRLILRQASCPVLLIPPSGAFIPMTFQHALLPISARTELRDLAGSLEPLLRIIRPAIRLVSIVGSANGFETGDRRHSAAAPGIYETRKAQARMMALVRELRHRGIATTWEVRHGSPNYEVVRAAETTGTDLIIVSPATDRGAPTGELYNSGLALARTSSVPVLIYPEPTPSSNDTPPVGEEDLVSLSS